MNNTLARQRYGLDCIIIKGTVIDCACRQVKGCAVISGQDNFVDASTDRRCNTKARLAVDLRNQGLSDIGHGVAGDSCICHILIVDGKRVAVADLYVTKQANGLKGRSSDLSGTD